MSRLGTAAQVFVVVVGVLLPLAAWRSRRRFEPGASGPPFTWRQYYASAFSTHLSTLLLARLGARDVDMELLGELRVEPLAWLATAAVFGALLATLPARWRSRSPDSRRRH